MLPTNPSDHHLLQSTPASSEVLDSFPCTNRAAFLAADGGPIVSSVGEESQGKGVIRKVHSAKARRVAETRWVW